MFKSINEDKKTFSKKVVDHIKGLITSGQLVEGDKLPAERELAEMMNVSRPTIREAYKILSTMGFVEIRHGNGVFVADHRTRIKNLASFLFVEQDTVHELFEVRQILETQTAEKAALKGKMEVLRAIEQKTKEVYEKVVVNRDIDMAGREHFLSESDQQFHLGIAKAAGNEVIIRIMHDLIDLLRESRMKSMQIPGRVEQSLMEHMGIAEALANRNGELARRRMQEHLSSVEQDLMQELKEM